MRTPQVILLVFAFLTAHAASAQSPPSRNSLKEAARIVLSSDCGNSWDEPDFRASAQLLLDAGVDLIPVLTDLLSEDQLSVWFVSSACRRAVHFRFSQPFREALRARRDDSGFAGDPGAMLGVFDYFAQFGDASDLAWMESAAPRFEVSRRSYLTASIKQARGRLSSK